MKSIDIPQADNLDQVRRVVQAVYEGAHSTLLCHQITGISPRHVGYALHAARVLGWIEQGGRHFHITHAGEQMLLTPPRSVAETDSFCAAVRGCPALLRIAPDLLGEQPPSVDALTAQISRCASLSQGTVRRRVQTLLYWRQRLVPATLPGTRPGEPVRRPRRDPELDLPPVPPLPRAYQPFAQSPPQPAGPAGPLPAPPQPPPPPAPVGAHAQHPAPQPPPPAPTPTSEPRTLQPGGLRLVAMQIERYGSIHAASAELSPFMVLIGSNTSGKSTLMDALSFLSDSLNEGVAAAVARRAGRLEELLWYGQNDSFVLACEFALPEPLRPEPRHNRVRYEVEFGKVSGGVGVRYEALTLRPSGEAPDYIPVVEPPASWRRVLTRTDKGMALCAAERSGWKTALSASPQKLALAALPEDPRRFPVAGALRTLLRERIRKLMLNPQSMKEPCSPLRPASLLPDGSNLPLVVQRLRERAPDRFAEWREQLRVALPEMESLRVVEREEDRHLYLKLTYLGGLTLPSWRLSEGTLRILALTLIPFAAETDEIYLIEEPENGIHPQAVKAVYENLSQPFGMQILLATHSPVIFGIIQPDQILCFTREAGSTRIIPGREHPVLHSRQREARERSLLSRVQQGASLV